MKKIIYLLVFLVSAGGCVTTVIQTTTLPNGEIEEKVLLPRFDAEDIIIPQKIKITFIANIKRVFLPPRLTSGHLNPAANIKVIIENLSLEELNFIFNSVRVRSANKVLSLHLPQIKLEPKKKRAYNLGTIRIKGGNTTLPVTIDCSYNSNRIIRDIILLRHAK